MGKHQRPEWAVKVADGIKKYCQAENKEPADLGRQLGAKPRVWKDIRGAWGISRDVEIYAQLFTLGIQAADPRTIPSYSFGKKGEKGNIVSRAWTENQYQKWLQSGQKKKLPSSQTVKQPPQLPTIPLQSALYDAFGPVIKQAIREEFSDNPDLAKRLLALLLEVEGEKKQPAGDIGRMADNLYIQLRGQNGQEIAAQYARQLAKLGVAIDEMVLQNKEDRERAAQLRKGVNSND